MNPPQRRFRHPIFARAYKAFSPTLEQKGAAEHRAELLAGLHGRVVEIGAGLGTNFAHYPRAVTEVVALEPEPYLRAQAEVAAHRAPIPVRVIDGLADDLPAAEASFDAGVVSLVLCSVPDQQRALAELRRVIRPGGELRFYEHIRADAAVHAALQRTVDLVWPWFGAGCHTSRDTLHAIEHAGFIVEHSRQFRFLPSPLAYPVAPHVIGVARRPT